MSSQDDFTKHMGTTSCAIIFAIVFFAIVCLFSSHTRSISTPYGTRLEPLDFNEPWTSSDFTRINASTVYKLTPSEDGTVSIVRWLPSSIYENDCINFNGKNIAVKVFIDDHLVYQFNEKDPLGGGSLDSYFHHVMLSTADANKIIRIQITPGYEDNSWFIADIAICSEADYTQLYLSRYGLQFVISSVIVMIGVLLIIIYLSTPRSFHAFNSFALGTASVFLGTWAGIETQVPMLLMSGITPEILSLDHICLYAIPYPLMVFYSSTLAYRSRGAETCVFVADTAAAVLMAHLCITGVMDWHRTLPLYYALLMLTLACITYATLRNLRKLHVHPVTKPWDTFTRGGMLVCIAGVLVEFFVYVFGAHPGVDAAAFLRVSFLVMQLILFAGFIVTGARNSQLAGETEAVRRLAYVDPLTGIGNRTAFDRALDRLNDEKDAGKKDRLVACLDVDNLKLMNDTQGHDAGDAYLRTAADLITDAFGEVGECFRVGGDEFDVIIADKDISPAYKLALERLRELEARHNAIPENAEIHISCGGCKLSETESGSFREAIKTADQRMYEDKLRRKGSVR